MNPFEKNLPPKKDRTADILLLLLLLWVAFSSLVGTVYIIKQVLFFLFINPFIN